MLKDYKMLESLVEKNIGDLMEISPAYLSDAGKAALEAYKSAFWYFGFYEDARELQGDEGFMNLVNISGKHPEYYSIIRKIYRAIEKVNKESE